MDLAELEAFVAVVETGSVASASARLGVPRSTLGRRLDALEARVGSTLVRREARGALPTQLGERLLPRARDLLADASSLLRGLTEAEDVRGHVRVTMLAGMPPTAPGQVFGLLRSMFPGLDLLLETSSDPLGGPLEGNDLILHWGEGPERSDWHTEQLLTARVWALARSEYLAKRGRPSSLEELDRHELLSWRPPGARKDRWPLLDGTSHPVKPALSSADVHLLRHTARQGHGIALVPDVEITDPEVGLQVFEKVLPDLVGEVVTVSLSGPARLMDLPRVEAVLRAARSVSAEL